MTTEISNQSTLPKDPITGLTLPLSKSLASQDLAKHRATTAFELEVMAKKMDRYGWERDRGTASHNRLMTDWMDVLQDYPLTEIQAACREWVKANPRKMPNEGDILGFIQRARAQVWQARKANLAPQREPNNTRISKERAVEILQEVGFRPKRA